MYQQNACDPSRQRNVLFHWSLGLARWVLCILALVALNTRTAFASDELSLHELLTTKEIVDLALSSDGRHLAFVIRTAVIENNSYDNDLFVVATTEGATPRHLGRLGPNLSIQGTFVSRSVQWAHNDQLIVSTANLDGASQVWVWNLQGDPPQRITSAAEGVATYAVIDGGNAIAYATVQLAGSEDERYLRGREAAEEGMVLGMLPRHRAASVLENTLVWGDYLGARGVERYVNGELGVRFEHWRYDLRTTERRAVNDASELQRNIAAYDEIDTTRLFQWGIRSFASSLLRSSLPRSADTPPNSGSTTNRDVVSPGTTNRGFVSPDGHRLARLVTYTRARIETAIIVSEIDGGNELERYRVVGRRLGSLAWATDNQTLYFMQSDYTDRGFESQIARLREGAYEPEIIYSAVNELIREVQFDFAANRAFLVESATTRPDQLVSIDLGNGARGVVYDPNPDWTQRRLPDPILIPLRNRFGVRSFGFVVPPINYQRGMKYPMVVVTYRANGFLRGGTGDEYPIYPLASAGFAVLALDVGEAYFYRQPSESGITARELSGQATLEEAIDQSLRLGFVDEDRIAITGLSYGAGLVWYAMISSLRFRAAIVSDSGIDPLPLYIMGHNPLARDFPVPPITREEEARWQSVSPALNAPRIRTPVLINDSDEEFWKLLQTTTTLSSFGKPWDMIVYPHTSHNISRPLQKLSIYRRNIDWLRFWLMDERDPDPAKNDQYLRWQVLREQHDWNEEHWRRNRDPGIEFARQRRALATGAVVDERALAPALNSASSGE